MIETLPCDCCKTKPLKPQFLRIRNELLKGNVIFFDNPGCDCCVSPEELYLGQMFYHNGRVIGDMHFPLLPAGKDTHSFEWTLEQFKSELEKMLSYKFDFSYVKADKKYDGNKLVIQYKG